jgi:predicted DNA binding CopG/RHH family protein
MADSLRGGSRGGAGRPAGTFKTGEKRDRNIGIRVSESELEMFKSKAEKAGMKLTDFIISLVENA